MGSEVFLTGASGFLGRAIVDPLLGAGAEITALVRPGAPGGPLPDAVRVCPGDLEQPQTYSTCLADLARRSPGAAVIHGASLISYRTDQRAAAQRVNVEATADLIQAMAGRGLERLVLVGSVVAVGSAPDAASSLGEQADWNLSGVRSAYVHSKRQQEELAARLCREHGIELVTVLPGAIFGVSPRASNTSEFLASVRRRGAPPLVPPGSLGLVSLRDTARGVQLALERGRNGARYLLVESNATLFECFERFADAFGKRPPRGVLPRPAWKAIVAAARGVDAIRRLDLLAPEALELLGHHFRFDAGLARRELGWSPEPFEVCLGELLDDLSADPRTAAQGA